ncbi:hypothetical protein GPECTOR_233g537 [Gonium pectorale]|uniref:Uncharacterized protein n=1 Tax=Gonium pectorale TaxID=33097 RepID=A0A150FWG7_GONPE|nr:hypothetical protein GPECTOR_233g537 [Gonium pectorale]|eukprot:KXZ41964.1 hypothetical protein GPECTOR_233g537 [Gonium pectorale]
MHILWRHARLALRSFYSLPNAQSSSFSDLHGHHLSASQLLTLNRHGALPSVARRWDARTVELALRNAAASAGAEGVPGPTAVQLAVAQRLGVSLPPGANHAAAAAALAAAQPPPVRHISVLYGVLGYGGPVPPSAAAARTLLKHLAQSRAPLCHALDLDTSPVALGQMTELYSRLGFVGRPPFSFAGAQTMAVCLRTILGDVEDEARLRPLPGMTHRQADLIRYLRTRRAPPGTRGLPAVMDLDMPPDPDPLEGPLQQDADPIGPGSDGGAASGRGRRSGVTRLAAARHILQLLQNHELSAPPSPEAAAALRSLGHSGPVPPCAGEAAMLAAELRDRCERPTDAQLAALAAAGYGGGGAGAGGGGPAAAAPPLPESVAHGWPGPMPATHGAAAALEEALVQHSGRYNAAAAAGVAAGDAPQYGGAGGGGGGAQGALGRISGGYPPAAPHRSHDNHNHQPSRAYGPGGPPYGEQYGGQGHYGSSQPHAQEARARIADFLAKLGTRDPGEALAKIQIRSLFPGAVSEWHLRSMCGQEADHLLACLAGARRTVLERVRTTEYDEYVERWAGAEAEGDWWGVEWLWH